MAKKRAKKESMTEKKESTEKKQKTVSKKYWIIGAGIIAILIIAVLVIIFSKENNNNGNGNSGIDSFAEAVAEGIETGSGNGDLEDTDPSIGSKDAPVVIIEFSDFQCPFCGASEGTNQKVIDYIKSKDATWQPAVPNIIKDYIVSGKVRLVFRDFPLGGHQYAQKASEAAECANDQGKYWEYHDVLFANQDKLTIDDLKGYASSLGLNTQEFNDCLDSGKYAQEVQDDFTAGAAAGVTGTPAFFINGELIAGAYPYSKFKEIIDSALE
ncbi:MAG: DsbA family protein [Candidatus Woesearchaeota archaeon]